jgi:hypothetical protein
MKDAQGGAIHNPAGLLENGVDFPVCETILHVMVLVQYIAPCHGRTPCFDEMRCVTAPWKNERRSPKCRARARAHMVSKTI